MNPIAGFSFHCGPGRCVYHSDWLAFRTSERWDFVVPAFQSSFEVNSRVPAFSKHAKGGAATTNDGLTQLRSFAFARATLTFKWVG